MHTARRLYVYLLTGVGVAVLAWGLTLLLTALFDAIGLGAASTFADPQQLNRERLTLATALTVVALPVWLIHWTLAERSVRPERPDAEVERSSAMRGLFFALGLGIPLIFAAGAAQRLIQALILALTNASQDFYSPGGDLALLIVSGAVWAYHLRTRLRDWARGPMERAGAWLPRTYLYLAVFVGLLTMLFALTGLVDLLRSAVVEPAPRDFGDARWWAGTLAAGVSTAIVGGAVWIGHWWFADRLRADPGWRGASERPARLRLALFVAVLIVASAAVLGYVGSAARVLIDAVLGLPPDAQPVPLAVSSLLSAGIFGVAWWLHARWLREESDVGSRALTAWRLDAYPLALVGLAFGAVAIAALLGLMIEALFGANDVFIGGDQRLRQFGFWVPFAVLGSALWVWEWSRIGRRHAADPAIEGTSAVRRAALLLVLAVSVLAAVAAMGVILYRVFGTLFGIELSANVAGELSVPIGALIVAAVVAAYHGLAVRRDQQLRAAAAADFPVEAPVPIGMTLFAPRGAVGGDIDAVLERLRSELPEGYRLEGRGP